MPSWPRWMSAVLVAGGWIVGWLVSLALATSVWVSEVPAAAVLMLVGWTIALLVMALVLRYGNGAEILCWGLLFVIVALSGAFYPVDAMPGLLQPIGRLFRSLGLSR